MPSMRPLFGWCPYLEWSVMGGSTVYLDIIIVSNHDIFSLEPMVNLTNSAGFHTHKLGVRSYTLCGCLVVTMSNKNIIHVSPY